MEVKYEDLEGVEHCEIVDVPIANDLKVSHHRDSTFTVNNILQDVGVCKAALLVHYVDLHNDYVLDARKSKMKFLELFQTFRYDLHML